MADASGGAQLSLGAVNLAARQCGPNIGRQARPGSKLNALALFGVGLIGGAGFCFLFLVFERDRRGANLALKVRRTLLDAVKLGSLFVVQAFEQSQFGHAVALLGLALAQLSQLFLGRRH